MISMEGFSSGIMDDHTPLLKYVTEVEKLEGEEEIDDEIVVITLKHSMDHTQVKAHLVWISRQRINMCAMVKPGNIGPWQRI